MCLVKKIRVNHDMHRADRDALVIVEATGYVSSTNNTTKNPQQIQYLLAIPKNKGMIYFI